VVLNVEVARAGRGVGGGQQHVGLLVVEELGADHAVDQHILVEPFLAVLRGELVPVGVGVVDAQAVKVQVVCDVLHHIQAQALQRVVHLRRVQLQQHGLGLHDLGAHPINCVLVGCDEEENAERQGEHGSKDDPRNERFEHSHSLFLFSGYPYYDKKSFERKEEIAFHLHIFPKTRQEVTKMKKKCCACV